MMGLEPPPDQGPLMFDDTTFMLDAAVRGMGVALARDSLIGQELRSGRLVQPFPETVDRGWGYFFVWRADSPKLKRVLRLRDWFVTEAASEADPD